MPVYEIETVERQTMRRTYRVECKDALKADKLVSEGNALPHLVEEKRKGKPKRVTVMRVTPVEAEDLEFEPPSAG